MDISVKATNICGKVQIISSKSELHRLLILSAFASDKSKITFYGTPSLDVLATVNCLKAVGADIKEEDGCFVVNPIKELPKNRCKINCNESGSTLRFILPIFCALGISQEIVVSGRLSARPLSPMYELLQENGVTLSNKGEYPLYADGVFLKDYIEIDGSVSSQFISGLLMAFAVTKRNGKIKVVGDYQSKSYVDITVDVIRKFGVDVIVDGNDYQVVGKAYEGKDLTAFGDWSNGSFFAVLGAISGRIAVQGLDINSKQGDKKIVDIIKEFGADVSFDGDTLTVTKNELKGISIDLKDIPDLAPSIAIVASVAKGKTTVYNGQRLRIKESDRINSIITTVNALGGNATETQDGFMIEGVDNLKGGEVDSFNDHRIVMASAIASAVTQNEIIIKNAQAVNKSYPQFFERIKLLGFKVKEV